MRRPFYFACTGTGPIDPADCMMVFIPQCGQYCPQKQLLPPTPVLSPGKQTLSPYIRICTKDRGCPKAARLNYNMKIINIII